MKTFPSESVQLIRALLYALFICAVCSNTSWWPAALGLHPAFSVAASGATALCLSFLAKHYTDSAPDWGMRIVPVFAWYDMWIGAYWDGKKRRLYFIVLTLGFYIQFKVEESAS